MPKLSTTRLTKRIVDDARPNSIIWDNALRGFGLRATPAGTKSFIIQYRTETGKQGRFVVGRYPADTVDEARDEAYKRLSGLKGGRDPGKERKARRTAPLFADLVDEYLETYAKSRNLRPRTIKDARSVLRFALPSLERRQVSEVATADIRKVHGEARKAAGVYQANRLLAVLSKMYSLANELGWRSDSPCHGVKKFPEDQRWRRLSEDEVSRLLTACGEYENGNPANAIRLLLFTGARLQEVLKADWSQFDLEIGLWVKPSAHTKTKRQHRLDLEGPALDLLRAMREQDPDGRHLFPGAAAADETGKITIKPRFDLKRPWAAICEAAKLRDVRIHDLRRTTASFMLDAGSSLATIGKTLGHTQASTTARYAHLSQGVQREELRKATERMVAAKTTVTDMAFGEIERQGRAGKLPPPLQKQYDQQAANGRSQPST